MTTDKANEKDFSDKPLQVMKGTIDKSLYLMDKSLYLVDKTSEIINDHIKITKFKIFVYTLMLIVYTKSMIEIFGWLVGTIICIVTFLVIYSPKNSGKTKRDISTDLENENAQIKKAGIFTTGKIIFLFILFLLIYITFSWGFYNYYVNPEITIITPKSGDDVKIDEDNTFHKISGVSKGLANNQFLHLFVLYRRVDSNKRPGYWYYEYDSTIYNNGNWECWVQLQDLYSERINETFIVKSPNNSSNNISTNVDIVAIITRQSIEHSIYTKYLTRAEEIDLDLSIWHNLILFYLPSGKGTFYDENYKLSSDYSQLDRWRYYSIPKHLTDSHVKIKPLIAEYNNTEYYKYSQWPQFTNEKLNVEITPYTDVYKGDTITICVWSCQMPIEEAEVYFNGNLLNKNTSENGTLFYTVNTSGNYEVTVKKKGFESYTTFLEVKEPEAKFEFSNLLITPSKVELGKNVNISIKAINIGNAKGEYEVKLVINGNIIDSKTINLNVGNNTTVGFIHKEKNMGKQIVEIEGETATFEANIPSIVYKFFILIIIVASVVVIAYIYRNLQSDKWFNKGSTFADLDRYEEALKAYDTAIKLKPNVYSTWFNKGVALYELGRCDEALKAYDKVIELKPDHAYAWYNRGLALTLLHRYEEALKALEKAIELIPDDAGVWHLKGIVLTYLDRYEEALKASDKSIKLKPDHAYAWYNKGRALTYLDRYEEALKAFEKAIELKPDYADAWYIRARIYSIKGDKEKSLFDLKKSTELDLSYKEKAKENKDFEKLWDDKDFLKLIE